MIDTFRNNNDDEALFALAKKYDDADVYEKALPIFEKLAVKGHSMAQSYLGLYYENGYAGLKVNIRKAFGLYLKSAEQCCADAMVNIGDLYKEGKLPTETNLAKAVEWYERAKELGSADALSAIGHLYKEGLYYEKDLQKAYDCYYEAFEKASDDEKGYHAFWIGLLFQEAGQHTEAFEYYEQAADLGVDEAYFHLGILCHLGWGTEKNDNRAFGFFSLAYSKGVKSAAKWLADCYREGQGTEVNYAKAFQLYEEASNNDDSFALESLGGMYNEGEGCERDWRKAFDYFSQAADLGNEDALETLSYFYDEGGELESKDELRECLLILAESEDELTSELAKGRLKELN